MFNTKTEAVFHIGASEKGTTKFNGYGNILSVDGNNGVIGFFEDGSVYIVNRDFVNVNTFTVNSDKKLTYMKDGIFTELTSNAVTLDAGAGILIKA